MVVLATEHFRLHTLERDDLSKQGFIAFPTLTYFERELRKAIVQWIHCTGEEALPVSELVQRV